MFGLYVLYSCLVFIGCAQALRQLNAYIEHYEPLAYQPVVATSHVLSRAKRQSNGEEPSQPSEPHLIDKPPSGELFVIEFESHGRHFPLRLHPDTSTVFHKDLVVESSDGQPVRVSLDHIVTGKLATEPRSHVFGAIRDGIFQGQINTQNDQTFYVERAHHYFNSSDYQLIDNNSLPFHSVIYSSRHVTDPYRQKRSTIGMSLSEHILRFFHIN